MAPRSRRSLVLGSALPTLLTFLLALGSLGPVARPAPAASGPPVPLPGLATLTQPRAGDPLAIALEYLRGDPAAHGLAAGDLAELRVSDRYVSDHTGVTHLYLQQQHGGIDVLNGVLNINVLPDGRILNLGNRFVGDL
ncbi:MAG TPA: hypothetical protein VGE07_05405, partial [Herpetosiphonaceae bacterium]